MTGRFVVQPRSGGGARQAAGERQPPAPSPATRPTFENLGPIAQYAREANVTDIFVNGARGLYLDRGGGPQRQAGWQASEREVRDLATSIIASGGRHLDDATPCIDVRLPGGVRVHAVLPPVSTTGTNLSIRVPRLAAATLDDLCRGGAFSEQVRDWLMGAVRARRNILVTGAAGCGKTTLLAALLAGAPEHERIVTIEDVAELTLTHPHHVALEARQPNLEGVGGIGLARLVRESLRMRPDRIVVGECRGEEIRDLLTALNTGHDGGAGTLHANSLDDVPARLEALGALAGMDDHAVARQVTSAIDVALHLERTASGERRLAAVGRFSVANDRLAVTGVQPWAEDV